MADQGFEGFDDSADDLGGYEFDFVDDEQEIDADLEGGATRLISRLGRARLSVRSSRRSRGR